MNRDVIRRSAFSHRYVVAAGRAELLGATGRKRAETPAAFDPDRPFARACAGARWLNRKKSGREIVPETLTALFTCVSPEKAGTRLSI